MAADVLIKLTLTPLMMWGVSQASRKWGGSLAGLLAGLPLTSGPISIYLACEQGTAFAAQAAITSISGVAATVVFYLIYTLSAKRLPPAWTFATSLIAFFLAIVLFRHLHLPMGVSLLVSVLLLLLSFVLSKAKSETKSTIPPASWDMPARIVVSTSVVLLVTGSAHLIGPDLSGLLSPIPAISWPLIVFAHYQRGSAEALNVTRGSLEGVMSVLVFYVIVALLLPQENGFITYAAALGGSALVVAIWMVARRIGRRPSFLKPA